MPLTPDRHPGPLVEDDGIDLNGVATHPVANGQIRYVSGLGFRFYDEGTEKGLGGSSGGVSEYDFLLDNEPVSEATDYAVVRTGNVVIRETWTRAATLKLWKSIDYTRVSGQVVMEVRKVFASDGSTIQAQVTVTYVRSGSIVTSAIYTRDI